VQPDLRVAVWGLGHHALAKVIPAVEAASGASLLGVCSRNEEVVAATAAALGCRGWTSADEMLGDAKLDVVYLSTPIGLHPVQGAAVLRAGKHLWCEKPLAPTLTEATKLVELSRGSGAVLTECFMYLFHPHFSRLHEVVTSGELGERIRATIRFGIPQLEKPGFRNDPGLGGGAFLDVGCYPISAAVALFGALEPDVADAVIDHPEGREVDRGGTAVLRCRDGAECVLEWRTQTAYRNEMDLWGSGGSLWTDRLFSKTPDYIPRLVFRDLQGNPWTESTKAANHFVLMIEAFVEFTWNEHAAEAERARILRRAALMERIRAAARTEY
jgi:dTDP-3,4-didehydro-2,6-dideoxy-alpha-D-glucose 3-reductase